MNKITQLLSTISFVFLAVSVAHANQQTTSVDENQAHTGTKNPVASGVEKPATSPSQMLDLPIVGQGRFDYLFWHIYNAQLQTVDGKFLDYQQSAPLVLSLTYQRDITKADFIDATLEQWQHQHGEIQARHRQWALLLNDIWQDVKTADTLSCQRLANAEVQFFLNSAYIGTIQDEAFADEFLDIWLSEKTSAPKLRKQLLQAASGSKKSPTGTSAN